MANRFVQILKDNTDVVISKRRIVTKHTGDWIKVNKKESERLISNMQAIMPEKESVFFDEKTAIVQMFPTKDGKLDLSRKVDVIVGHPDSIADIDARCILFAVDNQHINFLSYSGEDAFFEKLTIYDVVLITASHSKTIKDTRIELEANKAVMPSLFAPYHQNCAFGVQNNKDGQAFYAAWIEELENGKVHALTRALHRTHPKALFLNPDWGNDGR